MHNQHIRFKLHAKNEFDTDKMVVVNATMCAEQLHGGEVVVDVSPEQVLWMIRDLAELLSGWAT